MAQEKGRNRPAPWARKLAPLTILLGLRGRWLTIPLLVVLALWASLWFAWQHWGREATRDDYRITAESLTLTPQPAWIHSDVRAEVIRAGGLEGLSLGDPQLVEQVQRAFALNGWVARVKEVRKRYPARIIVDVEYRCPVAMVEVNWRGQPSLYFVDENSVLLPKEDQDKSPEERQREYQNYLRINAGDVSPAGRIAGQKWGGAKIAGAARLAALGKNKWQEMGVQRIVVVEDLNAQPVYELQTDGAARVLWGHAPGAEVSGEPEAAAKWAWLTQFVARQGPLDKSAAQQRIDLRTLPPLATARTAAAPDAVDSGHR
jgi:hypothetical protein